MADAIGVNIPDGAITAPAFGGDTAQHNAQKRQARGVSRPHSGKAHNFGRRAAKLGGSSG
jgi:hypothetical protein